jgi:acetylglutamate/LysW-gamma-L-alpha-aminoadipate kinase
VKLGGSASVDPLASCADVAKLVAAGERVVLVHGGSAHVEALAARLGVPQRRLSTPDGRSSRYTDAATLEVLTLAMAGQLKPRLLVELARLGVPAVGLTGIDAGLLRAERRAVHRAIVDGRAVLIRDDHTGRLVGVQPAPLRVLLAAGLTPVVSPPALAQDGAPVNVDADRAAAMIAGELGAARLVFLTGAPGLLRDPRDPTSLISSMVDGCAEAEVNGGMAVKLVAAREALAAGVARVLIGDGRHDGGLRTALDGGGTEVTARINDRSVTHG